MTKAIPNYTAFTLKVGGLANRIIIQILICKAFDPEIQPFPNHPYTQVNALWDTGASRSVITKTTAQALALVQIGLADVHHADGTSKHPTHLVNFVLPNNVGVPGLLVTESPNVVGGFGAIIGMDIIARGDSCITNYNNHTWLTFRMPSLFGVDYVQEHNRALKSAVRPKAPCPCGATDPDGNPIMFKACHGSGL
jgi:hypothetical protein